MNRDYKTPAGAAPPDWRGLCEELVEALDGWHQAVFETGVSWVRPDETYLLDRARAALAQPEPEVGPKDTQLIEEAIAVGLAFQPQDEVPEVFLPFDAEEPLNKLLVAYARAVLARWGRPAPAPAEGEVAELAEFLRVYGDEVTDEYGDVGEHDMLTRAADLLERLASPACVVLKPSPELIEAFQDALPGRIEPLLSQRHPTPVPVAERLPGPEDCDAQGRVWWLGVDTWMLRSYALIDGTAIPLGTHWLPATALPLPSGEVQP